MQVKCVGEKSGGKQIGQVGGGNPWPECRAGGVGLFCC